MIHNPTPIGRCVSSLVCCAALLLAGCGGGDGDASPTQKQGSGAPPGSSVILDQASIAPAGGDEVIVHAKVLGKDGSEIKGYDIAWASTDPDVAKIISASNRAPAAIVGDPGATATGAYARVLIGDAGGEATLTATLGLSDGTSVSQALRVSAGPKPATPVAPAQLTYRLSVSPGAFTLAANGLPQVATAVATRSDGVDGAAELTNWSWRVDDAAKFVMVAAQDGRSATIGVADGKTLGVTGTLTVCADTSAGDHLCANAALARPELALPSISFNTVSVPLKPGRSQQVVVSLNEAPGQNALVGNGATVAWSLDRDSSFGSLSPTEFVPRIMDVTANAANLSPWQGTLSVTVTYADGRSNSASLPVFSTGPWSRLPVPAGKVAQGIALKDNFVILLSTDGAEVAIDRIAPTMSPPYRLYAGPWPAASNLWVSEDNEYVVAELSARSGQMGFLPVFGGGAPQLFTNTRCVTGESRSSYAVRNGRPSGITWCPDGPRNVYYTLGPDGRETVRSLAQPGDVVNAARAFPDETFAVLTANGSVTGDAGAAGEIFTAGTSFAGSACAIKPWVTAQGTMLVCAATGGYSVLSWWIGTSYFINEYDKLYAAAPSDMLADGRYLYSLYTLGSTQTITASRGAGDTFEAGRPGAVPASETVRRMATCTAGGCAKAQVGLVFSDGSAWLYDEP